MGAVGEYILFGLEGLGIFVVYTLLILHLTGIFGVFVTPTSLELMKFRNVYSLLTLNFASSPQRSIKNFSEALPPLRDSAIWAVCLDPLFNYFLEYGLRLLRILYCQVTWDILEAGFLWSWFPYQPPPRRCNILAGPFSIRVGACIMRLRWYVLMVGVRSVSCDFRVIGVQSVSCDMSSFCCYNAKFASPFIIKTLVAVDFCVIETI